MGLLDELEQEAQRRKAGLDEASRVRQEREAVYKTRLEPMMQAMYEFLVRLIENLRFLKPRRALRYDIPTYGTVVAYVDHEYDLKLEAQQLSKEITLAVNAQVATDECPQVEMQGAPKVRSLNALFQKYRLAGLQDTKKDEAGEVASATFRARGKVPLLMTISADADSGVMKMSFTNFDSFRSLSKVVQADQFSDQIMDELARYVALEPSNLFKEELPDDVRRQLQQKVQQEQMRRKWEAKIADQQRDELSRLKNDQSLKAKVARTVEGVKDKAPSLLDRVKGMFGKKDD